MSHKSSYDLAELALKVDARVQGDQHYRVDSMANLQTATSNQLSFLANPSYAHHLETTQAGAVLLTEKAAEQYQGNALVLTNPYLGYAILSHLFDPCPIPSSGVDQSAVVHPLAQVDATACIGPNVVVAEGARIGAGVRLDAGTVIGADTVVGDNTHLFPNVTVYHGISIGKGCIIQSGAVIGGDGFGNAPGPNGWHKIAQIGGVIIGDNVEVGANTTIDRGALDNTEIRDGAKLDNLIQIAHNVIIGEGTAIASCVGISGSTTIGKRCIIAGQAGFAGHLTIADDVQIMGQGTVTKSISDPGVYSSGAGSVMPAREWRKHAVRFRQLDDLAKRLKKLEAGRS
ncbi:UDP-3-O-(3-hydroxymyristoyl)glucosamine N-acyltransferase [Aestuariirhabdus sp. Z084]|uniref:UDP-3-O-(3-hydroxymyristoyl)glucosamine N-acyltransferase n=1 Tax=Aestuariirhabdus haliotis TaxID=2918751 RepID=UPI00201B4574|nr:UDP-3-O-(3-hydroxymyristoyl)glucosamine N-acyltransferase [Aestuariirhabdus haliotis]MCL6416375.1 UDP-3-O-(3-hydroxymyristoyl)glucosamine N-acyltransferase [Aestuariirhabdus haliotis]MCL6420364.1 UDP-3-O-(3-hydroxymyristoyl)glucosamine N-acyltransferase [Aestuariirhabdus haliotis]